MRATPYIHSLPATLTFVISIAVNVWGTMFATSGDTNDSEFRIVSPEWVAEHSGDPTVKILDVRTSVADYQYGHIPNAIFLANDALRVPLNGVPAQYLDPEDMAAVFRRSGINPDDQVVVYAEGTDVLGATMVAYGLHRIGHEDVAVMDGGLDAYGTSYPLAQAYPSVTTGSIYPNPNDSIYVTFDELRGLMNDPSVAILDTRPAPDYLGNTSRWMRNGHIPGAINLDWHSLMEPSNLHAFKPVEEMRRIIESTGILASDHVVVYCGTSREATLVFQVMKHVLGYPNVRLYEGSWTEYASKMDMPVEREPANRLAALTHRPPTTDTLEPYECGKVTRLHTWNNIFLASQPGVEDFKQARMGGIRTVINQRHAGENKEFDESEVVTSLGMAYYNPAWNGPDELTDEIIDQTRDLLKTAERPVLLHCSSANRTGAIWLAYSALDRGLSWDEALAEAKTVGLRSPDYERIVKDYVTRQQRAPSSRSSSEDR
jgi:thiosulfate/3-mercaptopyruvate sulfurtransferase